MNRMPAPESGADDELLSREEIEALGAREVLEAAHSPEPAGRPAAGAVVLVVVGEREEASFLRAELELLGLRPLLVSDPYRALDVLRSGRVDWLLSALEPWGIHARLLVDRLGEVPPRVGTLLIGDGSPTSYSVAKFVDAAAILERPVAPGDLAEHLRGTDAPGARHSRALFQLRSELRSCSSTNGRAEIVVDFIRRWLEPLYVIYCPRSADVPRFTVLTSDVEPDLALDRFRRRVAEWPSVGDPPVVSSESGAPDDSRNAFVLRLGAAAREGWVFVEFSEPPPPESRVFVQELGEMLGREV